MALENLQASIINLLLLEVVAPYMAWRSLFRGTLQGDCGGAPKLVVRGLCAHLTRVVKSNSSGIKVWRGSLIQAGSRSMGVLIDERLIL